MDFSKTSSETPQPIQSTPDSVPSKIATEQMEKKEETKAPKVDIVKVNQNLSKPYTSSDQVPVPTSTENAATTSSGNSNSPGTSEEDIDFEPTAGMMIHDYDDERTMEEEENFASDEEDDMDELDDLNKESEMPLEELLASYRATSNTENNNNSSSGGVSILENPMNGAQEVDENGDNEKRSLRSTVLDTVSDSNSEDEDYESPANDDWKKKPRIGEEFQVHSIPNVEKKDGERYAEDVQVWSPTVVNVSEVENYLKEISDIHKNDSLFKLPTGRHTPDNEDALLLLKQCNNDTGEALRRYRSRPKPLLSELNIWSEEECMQFEVGLAIYGKDFHTIHQNKVKTKSVKDIVKFYYIWKKTERYDHFTAKTRLGKKKEPLHPGVTDYMERLLDENDHVSSHSNATSDRNVEYSNAPHTNALRDYIRTHYNTDEFQNSFSPDSAFDHLEVLQNQNALSSAIENSNSHHYLESKLLNSNNNSCNNKDLTSTLLRHQPYLQPPSGVDKTEITDTGTSEPKTTVT